MYPVAVLVPGDACDGRHQRFSDPTLAKGFPDKEIFEEQSAAAPGRVVVKDYRVSGGLGIPLGDEGAKLWMLSEAVARKIFFAHHHGIEFVFEFREFADHGAKERYIVDGGRADLKHMKRILTGGAV